MALEALLLSRDSEVLRLLRRIIPDLGTELTLVASVNAAADLLWRRKFDAFIIDCDELPGAPELLQSLRQGVSNRSTVVFALIKESSVRRAFELGANFVIDKPLALDRTQRSFRAALGLMVRERRRYFRHELEVPIRVELSGGKSTQFISTNVSEGGLAVRGGVKLPPQTTVRVTFTLPNGPRIEGKGHVAWSTEDGHAGVRLDLAEAMRRDLVQFLSKLFEAKQARPAAAAPASSRSHAIA